MVNTSIAPILIWSSQIKMVKLLAWKGSRLLFSFRETGNRSIIIICFGVKEMRFVFRKFRFFDSQSMVNVFDFSPFHQFSPKCRELYDEVLIVVGGTLTRNHNPCDVCFSSWCDWVVKRHTVYRFSVVHVTSCCESNIAAEKLCPRLTKKYFN